MPCAVYADIYSPSIAGWHEFIDCGKNGCKLASNAAYFKANLNPVTNLAKMNKNGLVLMPENITPKK